MANPNLLQNPDDIRLSGQDDLEALIGNPPGWTLRWGVTALLLGFALLLALGWFVRYPDVVQARATLTTENPPIRLTAGASARLSRLLVKNGQAVQAGELLGVLENPARLEDVERLEAFLKKLDAADLPSTDPGQSGLALPELLRLGSLQESFARFSQNFKELQYFLQQETNSLKISNLRRQIASTEELDRSLATQARTLADELALARRSVERDSVLFSKNSLSRLELEQSQSAWLRKRRELESLRSGSAENSLRIRQLEAQILDLQQLRSDGRHERLLGFRSDLQRLRSDLDAWKQAWLLVAPVGGEVALTRAWSEQQFVKAGEEVMAIVPGKAAGGRLVAKAFLPGEGAGKVAPGMTARIRLDGYPHAEFGALGGKVERIAAVPSEAGYEIEITLTDSLKTSRGKVVPFRQEMQGTARIVTEKRSLLRRVLERILAWTEEG